ncbi:MAG: helix-turn-helix domain-containing protein [Myxacorys californica WJT36-NPBG1]|jgi:excisionase family DNA binding protein|nr:helix-turn-helix domain-containing protein [Myxacorys californica WJT36-NPBG1]
MSKIHNAPITINPQAGEMDALQHLERLVTDGSSYPKLVGSDGKEIPLTDSIYQALHQVVKALAAGQAISLVPTERELSTQEAADLLNVSRPYLVKILEQGVIPFTTVGKHRRVKSQDLMMYKESRDAQRRQARKVLIEFMEEEGLYD